MDYIVCNTYNIQTANITAYSDENRKCLNEIELTYIILMAFTLTIGLVTGFDKRSMDGHRP